MNKKVKSFPSVSVIIPTKNEENVIEETLRRLRKSNYPKNKLEIIVVDANSKDRTRKIARKYANKIIIDKGIGKPSALDIGTKKARGDILYFIDADSHVQENTIRNLVGNLTDEHQVVAGMSLAENKNNLVARIGRLELAFANGVEIGVEGIIKTTILSGKNFVIHKDTLLEMDGFNNVLTEDVNLSLKLYRAKKKVQLIPAFCFEQMPDRFEWYWKQQERWLVGVADEVKDSFKYLSLIEFFVFLPFLIIRGLLPSLSLLSIALFPVFNSYILLFIGLLGILILITMSVRFLDKDDLLLFPVTFFLIGFLQITGLINMLIKEISHKKIKWYKTPKESYGPSKPQLLQT